MNTVLTSKTRSSLANVVTGSGYSLNVPKYVAWGSGISNASATDVALFNPIGSPISGTVSTFATSTSGDTFLNTVTLTASGLYQITELGLFDTKIAPPVGALTSQVNPGDTIVTLSGYGNFTSAFPFNIQVSQEVMLVTSGNGSNVFNVIRGANGSSMMTSIIPSFTQVVGTSGFMFLKSSFAPIGLQYGDSIQFNVSLQFI